MIKKYGCQLFYTPIEMLPTVAKRMREELLQKLLALILLRMKQNRNA